MPFEILEDLATADVAFNATGKTIEEMLKSAALALTSIMVKLETVTPKIKKEINIEEKNIETLFVKFLNELIYLKDADLLLFNKYNVKVEKNGKYKLKVIAQGEKINMEKHTFGVDVKAVTYHMLEVKEDKHGWKARVILDI